MLDMSWGEVMLIGGVALIVIGPKDLPKALRTVGQITTKLRRMAGEFQMQFNEAIREAELDEVRREVDGIRNTVKTAGTGFNPVQTIRDELKGAVEARVPKPDWSGSGTQADPAPGTLAAATAQLKAAEGADP
ncbi:Sec-independent protein translocase protein TatB, partial [Methylobacterium trifolii]